MAIKTFYGTANAVAQVTTVQITGYDGATTYTVTVGDNGFTEAISVLGDTDVNDTATALALAWNTSTHPYCTVVTAAAATDTVTFTADTAGCPFTIASSVTGGGGTIGAASTTTASASKFDLGTAANYDSEALPANTDTINFHPDVAAVHWGLDQSWTDMVINIPASVRVGLRSSRFAIAEDADTFASDEEHEYRDTYMQFDMVELNIGDKGRNVGVTRTAARRQKIYNDASAVSVNRIYSVPGTSMDDGLPTLRVKGNHAGSDYVIWSCAGGFGIGVDEPGEGAIAGDIYLLDQGQASRVYIGAGVTWTSYEQLGGIAELRGSAVPSTINIQGGAVETIGTYNLTTATIAEGAVFYYTSEGTLTTLNNAGTVDTTRQSVARTITNYNPTKGAVLKLNGADVTVTNWNAPTNLHAVTYS